MAFTPTEWEKQLMSLRALTATVGVMHEAQMLQLRNWGALAFAWTKWEAQIDIKGKTAIFVLKKAKHPQDLAVLVAGLDRSVHWLLGPDWGLTIREGKKILYEGTRERVNVNDQRKARVSRKGEEQPQ